MRHACPPNLPSLKRLPSARLLEAGFVQEGKFYGRRALCEVLLMGRTVLPFSQVLEQEAQEWKKFRRGLRKEDQEFLDRLFEEAKLHVQAGVYASRPWPFETILVSILIEHEKALVELRAKLRALEEKP
jgi:hypothetical protein